VNGNPSASRNPEERKMQIERLQVTNHERWGRLVKTWATGVNYLEDENNYPLPETMEEFKEQLAKAQVFATVPERFTKIEFVSSEQDTILVRIAAEDDDRGLRVVAQQARLDLSRFRRSTSASSMVLTR
jgi:hypothetical protein